MTPLELANRYVDLSNKSDLDAIRGMMTESTTYSSQNTGVYLGVDQIMAMQTAFHDQFASLAWEIGELVEIRPGVVRFEFEFSGMQRDGEQARFSGVEHVIAYGGKLQHIEVRTA